MFICFCQNQPKANIGIQPLGNFEESLLDSVSKAVEKIYHFNAYILPSKPIPVHTFINVKSPRFRADKIIHWLKSNKADSINYIMGILEKDISITKKDIYGKALMPKSKYEDWGVFGLGYRPGKASVVSTFRFKNNKEKLYKRLQKIAVHELGHNLGLPHCPNKHCIMTDAAESIKTIDNVLMQLCYNCRRKI